MVKYTCERCNKEYSKKSHYLDHINRKYPCVITNNNFIEAHNNDIRQQVPPPKKEFKCEECNKVFTRKDALKRHTSAKTCQKNKNYIDEIKQIRLDVDELKRLSLAEHQNQSITNNTINNTTNNIVINNNIILKAFGFEDYNCFKEETKINFINEGEECCPKVACAVYCNERLPQNANIFVKSIEDKIGYIYGNNYRWKTSLVKEIMKDVLNNLQYNVREYIEQVGHKCIPEQVVKVTEIIEDIFYERNGVPKKLGDFILKELVTYSHKVNVDMEDIRHHELEQARINKLKQGERERKTVLL